MKNKKYKSPEEICGKMEVLATIDIPPEMEKYAGLGKDQMAKVRDAEKEDKQEKEEEQRRHEEKYSVVPDTGVIKVASSNDKLALTMGEADELSRKIKKELAEKKALENEHPAVLARSVASTGILPGLHDVCSQIRLYAAPAGPPREIVRGRLGKASIKNL